MSNSQESKSWHHYRDVMTASARLLQQDKDQDALRLVDEAIATAESQNENRWVLTLSHHAAAISTLLGDMKQAEHYYQKSLAFNPENPRALSGLADIAQQKGEQTRNAP